MLELWVDSGCGEHPSMDRAVSAAIIDEAQALGVRAAAHIFYLEDARGLVHQGLDVVAHSVRDVEIGDAIRTNMRDGVSPTSPRWR